MHKVYEASKCEIDKIITHGITSSNLSYLGQLVDICKDIEEIWHYKGYHDSQVDFQIGELMKMTEHIKTNSSEEFRADYSNKVNELIKTAEKLRYVFDDLDMSSVQKDKVKNLYK